MSEFNVLGWQILAGTAIVTYYCTILIAYGNARISDRTCAAAVLAPPLLAGLALVLA